MPIWFIVRFEVSLDVLRNVNEYHYSNPIYQKIQQVDALLWSILRQKVKKIKCCNNKICWIGDNGLYILFTQGPHLVNLLPISESFKKPKENTGLSDKGLLGDNMQQVRARSQWTRIVP